MQRAGPATSIRPMPGGRSVGSALALDTGDREDGTDGGWLMRRSGVFLSAAAALGVIGGGAVIVWRRNPRIGSAFVNATVNPGLVRRGLAGSGRSEIGTLEHVGRRSGIRRLTPIHPEPTADGFRIMVPLGMHSEWARNVLVAGHCRLQLHDAVYDLDEPMMVPAGDVGDLPPAVRAVAAALGFQYLRLRTFDVNPGALDPAGPRESLLDTGLAVADDAQAGYVSPSNAPADPPRAPALVAPVP